MTSHCITWHDTTQAITSHQITWAHITSTNIASKQVTSPPWNSRRLVHSKEMVWASRWSVALRTFYRQILSLLYTTFFFWNFRPRLARELLVYIYIHSYSYINQYTGSLPCTFYIVTCRRMEQHDMWMVCLIYERIPNMVCLISCWNSWFRFWGIVWSPHFWLTCPQCHKVASTIWSPLSLVKCVLQFNLIEGMNNLVATIFLLKQDWWNSMIF